MVSKDEESRLEVANDGEKVLIRVKGVGATKTIRLEPDVARGLADALHTEVLGMATDKHLQDTGVTRVRKEEDDESR